MTKGELLFFVLLSFKKKRISVISVFFGIPITYYAFGKIYKSVISVMALFWLADANARSILELADITPGPLFKV